MIYFTSGEILDSVILFLFYGCIFSLGLSLLKIILSSLDILTKGLFRAVLRPPSESLNLKVRVLPLSGGQIFFSILIFTLGYILASYYALDASFRVYTLLLSLLSFYLTERLLSGRITLLFMKLLCCVFSLFFTILSLLLTPFRKIILLTARIIEKRVGKIKSSVANTG